MMRCKFEHDGDCCNSGASQYMCKCKQPCSEIIPITYGDLFRRMNNKEMGEFMVTTSCPPVTGTVKCDYCEECWAEYFDTPAEVRDE